MPGSLERDYRREHGVSEPIGQGVRSGSVKGVPFALRPSLSANIQLPGVFAFPAPRRTYADGTPMQTPTTIQLVGHEIAIAWSDGVESYFAEEFLRAASPSAENMGERDVLGRQIGGDPRTTFPGVTVVSWKQIGNYALQFEFSDGHRTGLYSFDYLRRLHDNPGQSPKAL